MKFLMSICTLADSYYPQWVRANLLFLQQIISHKNEDLEIHMFVKISIVMYMCISSGRFIRNSLIRSLGNPH